MSFDNACWLSDHHFHDGAVDNSQKALLRVKRLTIRNSFGFLGVGNERFPYMSEDYFF
tara:strand:- start:859 stop:1032 length:174 start_codon:yes stop_codon:yes gene_type:complete